MPQLQQCRIQATASTYTIAHSSVGSPTHWVRPGMEPASSWIQIWFVSDEPQQQLVRMCLDFHWIPAGYFYLGIDFWVDSLVDSSFFFFPHLKMCHFILISMIFWWETCCQFVCFSLINKMLFFSGCYQVFFFFCFSFQKFNNNVSLCGFLFFFFFFWTSFKKISFCFAMHTNSYQNLK